MISRLAAAHVKAALEDTPVVLIHGPRQCGKSTLAQTIAQEEGGRRIVTLDDPLHRALAIEDPQTFLASFKGPVVIDEIQRAPELFLPLKATVDRDRSPGRFLLTGSANVLALPKMADSLAGRMAIVDLLPFCQAEIDSTPGSFIDDAFASETPDAPRVDTEELAERIVRGGFPEPSMRKTQARRDAWFADYVRTLLERDVRDLANIEALTQLPRVLRLLAERSGETVNVVSLSRDTGIPNTSLHRYLDLLKALFLVQHVPAWSDERGTRLTKSPKAYLVDSGLLCYLSNFSPATLKTDPLRFERVLESFVAMELLKLSTLSDLRPALCHLRTVKQLEVDFVLEARGGDVVGIEVKPSATLSPSDGAPLKFLQELAGPRFRQGIVLYLGHDAQPLAPQIQALPISTLWPAR